MSETNKTVSQYGSWTSVIDADVVTSGNCRTICELQISNGSVFWTEQQFTDGRCVLYKFSNGAVEQWTPPGFSIRNSVHEYGGGSFIVVDEIVYFVTTEGVYVQTAVNSEPKVVVKSSKMSRFADLCYYNGFLYAVNEVHLDDGSGKVENALVKITTDGTVETVVSGRDFYACPRISPDGKHIAWMEWNSPFMPWDDTSIKMANLGQNGSIGEVVMDISKSGVNFHGLQWSPESELFVISDETGWWNVYSVDVERSQLGQNVYNVNSEIGSPPWIFGDRQYATNKSGLLLNVSGHLIFKGKTGALKKLVMENFEEFSHLSLWGDYAFCIASGPQRCASVLKIHLDTEEVSVIRESRDVKDIERYDISLPKNVVFDSDGVNVHGWFYPPFSRSYEAPKQTLPPVVLMAHGGPTAKASNSLSMKVQFFTSRGFAVFDVNYRGSTGYGTNYRNMLRKKWGIVDRNDMINAAEYLAKNSMVDPRGICIMGSSAGGYLLLSTLLHSDRFSAAASLYGVSDLIGLCKDTHKFEQGYNEQLIGKYPEEASIYKERSPILAAGKLRCPTCFFHGTEDAVVPISQSVKLYEAIKAKGIPTALIVFPGEGHGFRGHDAVQLSITGVYYFFCRVLKITPSVVVKMAIENLARI